MSETAAPLRDVVIVGGGCYGNFYAGQLEAAQRKGAAVFRRLLLVDRDPGCLASRTPGRDIRAAEWDDFLSRFLTAEAPAEGQPDDAIVPSPLMPHLMATWLLREVRLRWPGRSAELVAPVKPLGTPYDALGPDGTRYVSYADWICPTHCVEPLTCPMIKAPRTWEMGEALAGYVRGLAVVRPTEGPALFTTRHHAYGVGLFGAGEIRTSRALVEGAARDGSPVDIVIGTVSACHGAVSILRLGAATP